MPALWREMRRMNFRECRKCKRVMSNQPWQMAIPNLTRQMIDEAIKNNNGIIQLPNPPEYLCEECAKVINTP